MGTWYSNQLLPWRMRVSSEETRIQRLRFSDDLSQDIELIISTFPVKFKLMLLSTCWLMSHEAFHYPP